MAASISQTRYDYKIDLQKAITEGKIIPVAFEKCPLCYENRSSLLCDTCVNEGDFTHTQRRNQTGFKDKKREWEARKKEREDVCRRFELEIEDIERANAKTTDIEAVKRKINLLKKALAGTKAKCEAEKRKLSQDKKIRRESQARLDHSQAVTMPNLKQKIANLTEPPTHELPTLRDLCDLEFNKDLDVTQLIPLASKTLHKQQRDSKDLKEGTSIDPKSVPVLTLETQLYHQYLARKRADFVSVLSQRIIPVFEVLGSSDDNLEMSMATAIKDACETAFLEGRWVHVDNSEETHCEIVNCALPDISGESSARSLFVLATEYRSLSPDKIDVGNPSYGVLASLQFTALFITLAANIFDIHLPRKCSFSELKDDTTEADFCNFVWRLHQNILHLAYSQEAEISHLMDFLSLYNVLAIICAPNRGRTGAFVPAYVMPVEAELCPLEYEDESEEEPAEETSPADLEITRDWERVPAGLPTYDTSNMVVSSPVDNNTSTAGALFNAAAASLTGWFTSYYGKK